MVFDRHHAEAVFARRLLPLARRWRQAADDTLSEVGLSDANGWVLIHVSRAEEGIHQGVLADLVDISGASLVRRLDQLEAAGLVERAPDASDRRANYVKLTPEGRRLAAQIERAFAGLREDLMATIANDELAAANTMLERLDERIARRRKGGR
jgi:MarR family transcriptional regulator for hemolysin